MQLGFPPDYVLDKMEWYEVNAALKYQHYAIKDGWEQARLIYSIIYNANTKHPKKMNDLFSFTWEKEQEKTDTSISNEDIERLNKMAQAYLEENT